MRIRVAVIAAASLALLVSSASSQSLKGFFGGSDKSASKKKSSAVQESLGAYADRMLKTIQSYLDKGYSIEARFLLDDLKKVELPADKKNAVAQLDAAVPAAAASSVEASFFNSGVLTRVKDSNGKYGYIDRSGAFVIEAKYEVAKEFSEGLALVGNKGIFQYIDATGATVLAVEAKPEMFFFDAEKKLVGQNKKLIPFKGDPSLIVSGGGVRINPLGDFHCGLAHWKVEQFNSVRDEAGNSVQCRSGDLYIDKAGKEVLFLHSRYSGNGIAELAGLARYDDVSEDADFRDGLVRVYDDGAYLYLDKSGKSIVEPEFRVGDPFSNGLACVSYENSDKWGFIDTTGKVAIKPFFTGTGIAFSDEVCVLVNRDAIRKKGFIFDKTGKALFNFEDKSKEPDTFDFFSSVASSGDLMIPTVHEAGDYPKTVTRIEVLDSAGKLLFSLAELNKDWPYTLVQPFSNGRAFVNVDKYAWAIIDARGNFVAKPSRDWVPIGQYRNGLAAVKLGSGRRAYLDREAKVVFTE